ncbi:hypothetical protein [Allopontixanthobacter sp.]|uniref:hypothetical protein n=1 Tax=Allopontixanthobacter sp. TaxID=2906452 RepID=UPI002AB9753D|nr:hypothetical protein [Allopontixanthobacter sp.]MDZ4307761.1 hypothetical protein [Allopontixanthobacter sp.]
MMYLFSLAGGLAGLFWFFGWLEIRVHRSGVAKYGEHYQSTYDVIKIGYVCMFLYFAALSLAFSDGNESGDYFDPCTGSMRC